MNSTLVRFHGKSYYVDYDDLLNKANNKLFAYEDAELTKNAKLNGLTLMFDKSEMEDELKKDIKMPTRMPSNLATESSNGNELKILKLLNSKKNEIIKDVISGVDVELETKEDLKQYIKDLAYEYIPELRPVAPKTTTDWRAHESMYSELVDSWVDSTLESLLKNKGNKMTNINEMRSIGKKNIDKLKKIMHDMWAKNYNITEDEIIEALPVEWWDTWESADSEIRRLVHDFLNKLKHARSIFDESKLKERKMTNEQKLRSYIREYIVEILKEGGDPYGRPDEDKYLFKTGDEYLAGIQGEAVEGGESPEELAAKETAAKEKAEKTAYSRFFSKALAKFGYSGAASIPDEKKREFWDFIDSTWVSKQEAPKKKVDEAIEKVRVNNKVYDANVFFDDDAANDFMERNPGWGVIKVDGKKTGNPRFNKTYRVYVAKNDDMGKDDTWTDPAGGIHSHDEEDPAKMYETSATGGVAGYETPMAFTGKKGVSKKQKSIANQLGYELVDKSYSVKEEEIQRLDEEKFEVGDRVSVSIGSGLASEKKAIVVGRSEIKLRGDGVPTNVDGAYKRPDWNKEVPIKYEDGTYDTMFKNRLIREGMDTLYFKDENLSPEQKLGLSLRHIRNNLTEVEKLIKKSIALKNENNIDTEKIGKRTYSALRRINEKTIRLMVALNDLK